MAKFNIEVNLDWVEEDGTIDDALKSEIISAVTGRIAAQTTERIDAQIASLVEKQAADAEKMISEKLAVLMEDFMTRPRIITDKWGDVKRSDVSVMDMLKTACDEFIDGYVNKNGDSVSKGSYDKYKRRIDFIIEKQIDFTMQQSIKRAAEEIKKGLQQYIDETLKAQIGENVAKIIGLDKITGRM